MGIGFRITAFSVEGSKRFHVNETSMLGKLDPEIPVFIHFQIRIEAAMVGKQRFSKQDGMDRDEVIPH